MNAAALKIIACLTMLIDHVGDTFFPESYLMRLIGRLSFPLFAYLIVEGYRHTRDRMTYLCRLTIIAYLSQLPYVLLFEPISFQVNVLFTLAGGLMALHLYDKYHKFSFVLLIAAACETLHPDYGLGGILLIFVMHIFYDDLRSMTKYFALIIIIKCARQLIWNISIDPGMMESIEKFIDCSMVTIVQPFSIFSMVFIKYYNHEKGKMNLKYLIYAFYPLHMLALAYIRNIMQRS